MAVIKTKYVDICEVCGEPTKVVKIAKNSTTKKEKVLTGMVWLCDNGHRSRTRIHKQIKVRVG